MIDLYTWGTPNGRKISIMLEEIELEYNVIPINITKNEQFSEKFSLISPNNKIPVITDNDEGVSIMESGAILSYLSKKSGKLIPVDKEEEIKNDQWLMFQMASLGPMCGQAHHYLKFNVGKAPYTEKRLREEVLRLYKVMDNRLKHSQYFSGPNFRTADIAIWPWVSRFEWHQADLNKFVHVSRWYKEVSLRSSVKKGYDVPENGQSIPMPL